MIDPTQVALLVGVVTIINILCAIIIRRANIYKTPKQFWTSLLRIAAAAYAVGVGLLLILHANIVIASAGGLVAVLVVSFAEMQMHRADDTTQP